MFDTASTSWVSAVMIWLTELMTYSSSRHSLQKYLETNFVHVCVLNCSVMSDSLPPHGWTVARQAPLSMGFARQEYWSGLPCPPPGGLPHPGTETMSCLLLWQAGSLLLAPPGKPKRNTHSSLLQFYPIASASVSGYPAC